MYDRGLPLVELLIHNFVVLVLSECWFHIVIRNQFYLVVLTERDCGVDPSDQEFQSGKLDIKQVQAEHRNEVVHEARVENICASVFVGSFVPRNIVICLEVDAERCLQQRGDSLVQVNVHR